MRRVLLDHCVPRPFRSQLAGCMVSTAAEMGWSQFKNGDLLDAAEKAGFEVLITADKGLRYQQNMASRKVAIIELPTNRLRHVIHYAAQVNAVVPTIAAGAYEVIPF